jgi:hypothetical protein
MDEPINDPDELLPTGHLRKRYKKSAKTIREWELSGVLPPPERIAGRKYWRRRVLEEAERAGMGRTVGSILFKKRQPPKAVGFRKGLDMMRDLGAILIKTKSANGDVYYLVPGGYVEPKTAEKLIQHPQVRGAEDGLLPGFSQTWRFVGA